MEVEACILEKLRDDGGTKTREMWQGKGQRRAFIARECAARVAPPSKNRQVEKIRVCREKVGARWQWKDCHLSRKPQAKSAREQRDI